MRLPAGLLPDATFIHARALYGGTRSALPCPGLDILLIATHADMQAFYAFLHWYDEYWYIPAAIDRYIARCIHKKPSSCIHLRKLQFAVSSVVPLCHKPEQDRAPPLLCGRRPVALRVGGCAHLDHHQHSYKDGDPTCYFPASEVSKAVALTLRPRNRGYVCISFNVSSLLDKHHCMMGSSMPGCSATCRADKRR